MQGGSKLQVKRTLGKAFSYGLIALAVIVVLLPLYWTFSTSLKGSKAILHIPPELFPRQLTFSNYVDIFEIIPFGALLLNSAVVTGLTTVISLVLGSLAAYGLSRYKFPGSGSIFGLVLGTRMIPPVAYVIPLYLLISNLMLLDTWWGLILAHTSITLPFTIWIMKGFFDELPRDFEEAAMVDGCSRLGALRVALRLALPGLFVALIFVFVESWNEFMFAVTITRSSASKTVLVGLVGLLQYPYRQPWGELTAGLLIYTLPIFFIAYFFEKYIAKIYVLGVLK